jgi:hypothetical protein
VLIYFALILIISQPVIADWPYSNDNLWEERDSLDEKFDILIGQISAVRKFDGLLLTANEAQRAVETCDEHEFDRLTERLKGVKDTTDRIIVDLVSLEEDHNKLRRDVAEKKKERNLDVIYELRNSPPGVRKIIARSLRASFRSLTNSPPSWQSVMGAIVEGIRRGYKDTKTGEQIIKRFYEVTNSYTNIEELGELLGEDAARIEKEILAQKKFLATVKRIADSLAIEFKAHTCSRCLTSEGNVAARITRDSNGKHSVSAVSSTPERNRIIDVLTGDTPLLRTSDDVCVPIPNIVFEVTLPGGRTMRFQPD